MYPVTEGASGASRGGAISDIQFMEDGIGTIMIGGVEKDTNSINNKKINTLLKQHKDKLSDTNNLSDLVGTDISLETVDSLNENKYVRMDDGTACNDRNADTTGETWLNGVCQGGVVADGVLCNDNNVQTINDIYTNGVCAGTNVQGQTCNDGQANTINDVYNNGVCVGTLVPNGTTCNDTNVQTINDTWLNGVCSGTNVQGQSCNDGNWKTYEDKYTDGMCAGTPSIEYTFASSVTATAANGIPLSSYVNPAAGKEFIINVNSSVTLSSLNGAVGAGAAGVKTIYKTNCSSTQYGNGGNGGKTLDLTGFASKKITVVNNGTIKGGNGGNGGNGGVLNNTPWYVGGVYVYSGCGGSGGLSVSAANAIYNPSAATFSTTGNAVQNGVNGTTGTRPSPTSYFICCNCCGGSCFVAGQKVLMADNSYKNIEDVLVGDKVIGAYGNINTVLYYDRPMLGNRYVYDVDGLLTTDEHGILNGDKNGFLYISMESGENEYGTTQIVLDKNMKEVPYLFKGLKKKKTKREQMIVGKEVASENSKRRIKKIEELELENQQLYHLIVDGDMTYCISNTFVSSMANDRLFDYNKGIFLK